jgi:hypothetical protein
MVRARQCLTRRHDDCFGFFVEQDGRRSYTAPAPKPMKRTLVIALFLLVNTVAALANGGEEFPFHVGEKLIYQICWGPFVVGRASLEVEGIEQVDGQDCYHLVALAKTSGLTEVIFPVNNTVESWLDVKGLFTRRFRQNRSEGKHARQDETQYDYEKKLATTTNLVNGKVKQMELTEPVLDVISSLYYVRTQPLKLDTEQLFLLNAVNTNMTVNIRPDQRKLISVRPVGEVQALRIEPKPTFYMVAANNGRMWFWISDDARRLPLLVN